MIDAGHPSRAVAPARTGRVELRGVSVGYETFGEGEETLLLLPPLKTAPFCFLTDFVGWLPMPEGGEREAALTFDYNAAETPQSIAAAIAGALASPSDAADVERDGAIRAAGLIADLLPDRTSQPLEEYRAASGADRS